MFRSDNVLRPTFFQNSVINNLHLNVNDYTRLNWLRMNHIMINNIIIDPINKYNPNAISYMDINNIGINIYDSLDFLLTVGLHDNLYGLKYNLFIDLIIQDYINNYYLIIPNEISTIQMKYFYHKETNYGLLPLKFITNNLLTSIVTVIDNNLNNMLGCINQSSNIDTNLNNNFRNVKWNNRIYDKPDDCPVCFNHIENHELLSCGHHIHKTCLINSKCTRCPMCREEVYLSDLEFNQINN